MTGVKLSIKIVLQAEYLEYIPLTKTPCFFDLKLQNLYCYTKSTCSCGRKNYMLTKLAGSNICSRQLKKPFLFVRPQLIRRLLLDPKVLNCVSLVHIDPPPPPLDLICLLISRGLNLGCNK